MPYTIQTSKQAVKFLRNITDRRLALRLRQAIDELAATPHPPGCLKLQGNDELYRVRVGDYRVIYQIQDAVLVVLVVQIGHRRDIYR